MDTSLLATGGIAAAAVGFWHQVQSAARYVSSFVVVSATIEHPVAHAVSQYLKTEWRVVPSGQTYYLGAWFKFRDSAAQMMVPFRVRSARAVYYKRHQFILKTGVIDVTLWSIRGLVDFDRLVSDAIDAYHLRQNAFFDSDDDSGRRAFFIEKVIGREKDIGASGGNFHEGALSARGDDPGKPPAASHQQRDDLDISIDRSFKYDRDLYVWTDEVDPFEGLYFDAVVGTAVRQAEQWFGMGPWYVARNIPWRRGWLLHGPGGTGKSSLAKATARKLNLPIYQFFLATLSDQEFVDRWENMQTPCMALFEDFDTVFHKREPRTQHKSLTFQCVLNQISGVSSMNGVFLVVTTNHVDAIDEAMGVSCGRDGISTRPGRIDTVIEIGCISEANRRRMGSAILRDWPDVIPGLVKGGDGMTPIQFQEQCIQTAFSLLAEQHKEAA